MRIFVAGATGAIGRRLVPALLAAGHEVTGMTRSPERAEALRASGVSAVVADAYDAGAVREAVAAAAPEVVVDELTDLPREFPSSPRKLARGYTGNDRLRVEGCANVLAAARAAGARRYVAESIAFMAAPGSGPADESAPLAADAADPIGASARAVVTMEQRVLEAGDIEGVVLRYGQFYGDGTWFAPGAGIAELVRKRRYPIVGGGTARGSFVHLDDAVQATVRVVEGGERGVFHVCADETPTLAEWLPEYARDLGAPPPRKAPAWLARLAAGSTGVWFSTAMRAASNARARAELGFSPRAFRAPSEP
jgi:nucleoside-diphosphate-sugar epimerase